MNSALPTLGVVIPALNAGLTIGAAINAVHASELRLAHTLIAEAPPWPAESCFGRFHSEIPTENSRRDGLGASPTGSRSDAANEG